MPELITTTPEQQRLEAEFASLTASIRGSLEKLGLSVSNTLIGGLIDRDRLWIERRLLAPGEPTKVSVKILDAYALRYVANTLEAGSLSLLHSHLKD